MSKVSADLLAKNKQSYDGLRLKGYLDMADRGLRTPLRCSVKPTRCGRCRRRLSIRSPGHCARIIRMRPPRNCRCLPQKNKTFAPIYDLLFTIYNDSGRHAEAENILKAKADNNPKQAAYLLNLAAYYRYQKRPEDVKKTLQRLLDNSKEYEHPHALVGDFYLGQRDVAAAMNEYNEGIKSDPKDKALYQKRIVNTLMLEGKKDEAKATLGELAKSQPKDDDVQLAQAKMWIEGGKPADVDAAITTLKPLVDKKPGDANRHFRLGQAYMLKGGGQDAENEWKAAAKERSKSFASANCAGGAKPPNGAFPRCTHLLR